MSRPWSCLCPHFFNRDLLFNLLEIFLDCNRKYLSYVMPSSSMSASASCSSSLHFHIKPAPPRCDPDPLDPEANVCLAKVTTDGRQGISHFFGRNKKATNSIPEYMFPLLCRTHYQEKQYRWKEDPSAYAAFQCDCILKTLERMAGRIWTDDHGVQWPYWCGFVLQAQRPGTDPSSNSIPDWLQPLCTSPDNSQTVPAAGYRRGIRYSFTQLQTIVKAIKTWCVSEAVRLPSVEALPVTIGLVDEADREAAKMTLKNITREYTLAMTQLQKYTHSRRSSSKVTYYPMRAEVKQKQSAVENAKSALNLAEEDCSVTLATIPIKRKSMKKRATIKDPSILIVPNNSELAIDKTFQGEKDMSHGLSANILGVRNIVHYDQISKE